MTNAKVVNSCLMEKTQTEILKDIMAELSAIRLSLNSLESKLSRLNIDTPVPVDLDLDSEEVLPVEDEPQDSKGDDFPEETPVEQVPEGTPVEQTLEETPVEQVPEGTPVEQVPEAAEAEQVQDEAAAEQVSEEAPEVEPVPEAAAQDLPSDPAGDVELDLFGAPVLRVNEKLGATRARSVGEKMEFKEAWRTALPGSPVKDVRSAISLNDRVLFIRELFNGDATEFQKAADAMNAMHSLDEMVDYAHSEHPDWDLDSDSVYRLMMAVRRKLSGN